MNSMEIVVDGNRESISVDPSAPLGQALGELRRWAAAHKRIIISMNLAGESVTPERERQLAAAPPPPDSRLEVQTQDFVQFSRGTISNLREHSSKLEAVHQAAAADVIAGKYRDALLKFEDCFLGWQVLTQTLRQIGELGGLDLKSIEVEGKPLDEKVRSVEGILSQFRGAFQGQDVVRVGDLVQYELLPLLKEWRGVLDAVDAHLAGLPGASS